MTTTLDMLTDLQTPIPPVESYDEFVARKVDFDSAQGFAVDPADLNPMLLPHQRDIVTWALAGGRRAIFAAFGLGKTLMQLEILARCVAETGGMALVVLPLGVRTEFALDAEAFGYEVTFIRSIEQTNGPGIYLTNYETIRDGKLDPAHFAATSLDEAAVLRSFGSKTYQTFLTLFDSVQYRFVATATPSPNRYKELIHYAGYLGVMDTGQALAQPLTSKVLTPAGWREMSDVVPGDLVIGRNGKPTRVLGVYPQGEKPIFKVTFSDGTSARCTGEHLWLTRTQYERNAAAKFSRRNPGADDSRYWTVKDTATIADSLMSITGSKNHEVPLVEPVMFDPQQVLVDPYLLGFLIGDGTLRETSVNFTTADQWIVDEVADIVAQDGLHVRKNPHVRADGQPNYDYSITAGATGRTGRGHESNAVLRGLRRYGLLGKRAWEKRIPDAYLFNTPDVRLAVLQGLMDADGTISTDERNRTTRLCTTSAGLADDTVFIVQSLGGTARVFARQGRTPGGEPGREQYVVTMRLPNGTNPFRLPRKAELVRERDTYPPRRYIVAIEPDGTEPAQCIAVEDPERLYVTDAFAVTHNTRFFQRDSTQANNLTLYPHKREEFHLWLHTWACFVQEPRDICRCDCHGGDA